MLGNRVEAILRDPDATISGELRRQSTEGVWIYHGYAEFAAVHFYPAHRVIEIIDKGYVHR